MADAQYNLSMVITANNKAIEEINKIGTSVDKVKGNVVQLSETTKKTLKTVGVAATAVAGTMVAIGKASLDAAIEMEPVKNAFQQLTDSVGESSDKMLKSLREASKGAVSDYDLMLAANTSMKLGVATNTEDLTDLMKIARLYGQQMGEDTSHAFDDIVRGLGRGSAQILDNLGIVVDSEKAYEDYATQLGKTSKELTDAEKKQAIVNATLVEGKKALEQFGEPLPTMAERIAALKNQFQNIKVKLGEALMPIVEKLMSKIAPIIEKISDWIETHSELAVKIGVVITAVAGFVAALSGLALILPSITTALGVLTGPIGRIIAAIGLLATARAKNRGGIREKTAETVEYIKGIVGPRLDEIKQRRSENGFAVIEIVKRLRDAVKNVVVAGIELVQTALKNFFAMIDVIVKIFKGDRKGAREGVKDIVKNTREGIQNITDTLFGPLLDKIAEGLVAFGDKCKNIRNGIKEKTVETATAMRDGIKQGFEFRISIFSGDRQKAYDIASGRISSFDSMMTEKFGQARENIKAGVQKFYDDVVAKFNALKDKVKSIVDAIKNMWNSAKQGVGDAANKIRNGVSSVFKAGGGNVYGGQSYIVGEKGPELFTPSQNGTITPNNQITNNNGIEINMNGITVRSEADIQNIAQEIVRQIKLEKDFGII